VLRGINLSAAIIVLICFFLPWIQIGCGQSGDAVSGLRIAGEKDTLLWLIPLLMFAVLTAGLLRARKEGPPVTAIVGIICGAASMFVLNHDRLKVNENRGVLPMQFTGWFWLAMISSFVIVASGVALLMRRRPQARAPNLISKREVNDQAS
jgi:hypothetical protein